MKRRGVRRTSLTLQHQDLSPLGLEAPPAFLGRFSPEGLQQELDAAGITQALADRGYGAVERRIESHDGEHRLRLWDRTDGGLLVDLRLAESTATALPAPLGAQGVEPLQALVVLWVALQDPRAPFTERKPRLPGQDHPGLGVGRRVYEMLRAWCERWGKDALVNVPEYYHNAVFYASSFRFLAAAEQGRFEALRRDLAHLHVAEASTAIDRRRVFEEPAGRPFDWDPGDMAAPVAPRLQAALQSDDYVAEVAAARDAVRFTVIG